MICMLTGAVSVGRCMLGIRSGLKWIGGKNAWADKIAYVMPEHNLYAEPFVGGGSVLVNKVKSAAEYVSDRDPYLINFYRIIQTQPDAFFELMQHQHARLLQVGKQLFESAKAALTDTTNPITDLNKAVCFYIINKHSMNGIWRFNKKGECNCSWGQEVNGRGIYTYKHLMQIYERLKHVYFTCCDYKNTLFSTTMIAMAGLSKEPFIFLDPPYHNCKTTYNGVSWKDKNYIEFKEQITQLPSQAKWLLTINDDPFIRNLFKEYEVLPHDVHYSCSQTNAGRGKRPELLIANYPIENRLKEFNEKKATKTKKNRLDKVAH